ncbi:hypothetical protein [Stenotrophomonas acidaminiphila]|uniref:hypothetical protein n=1 Tax=Stenotrophomonas acidaminiphila TaxID=128780 RepID=UPI0028AA906F|nr:hypothetical protein [Stenotrophomonas acidaminiphila]
MVLAGMVLVGAAQAQQASPPAVDTVPAADPAADPVAASTDAVRTLEEVRALKPEDDTPLDLYRFRNPVKIEPNRFSRSWSEPPTPEQVSQSGGYLLMGISYGLMAAAKGLHKLTGGRDQIQSAIARPPPELSEDQRRRALRFCAQQEGCQAPPGD